MAERFRMIKGVAGQSDISDLEASYSLRLLPLLEFAVLNGVTRPIFET